MLNAPSQRDHAGDRRKRPRLRRQVRRWCRRLAGPAGRLGVAALLLLPPPRAAQGSHVPAAEPAVAGPLNWSTANDFGGVGLLQNRTARFRPDGELDVGAVFLDPYKRYYISFQALPWLEGTFRYTEITNRSFSEGGLASDEDFQDRGADLKFRLLEESRYLPQIAFGLQDGIGTGLFSSEFLVFSKAYYDLDFSFGVGWGYLASGSDIENPMINISDSFANRTSGGNFGGEANFSDYLSGPNIGLFGGVAWRTPVKGLTVKLETSTQDYQSEPLGNQFEQDLPFNLGFVYRPFPWLELSGSYERGNTAMFRASLRANVADPGLPKFDPPPPKLTPRDRKTGDGPGDGSEGGPAVAGDPGFALRPQAGGGVIQPGDPVAVAPQSRLAHRGGDETAGYGAPRDEGPGNSAMVDALFAGFAAQSMQISSVESTAGETRIYLSSGLREAPKWRQVKAAQHVAAVLPSASRRVTLIERRDGRVVHQSTLLGNEIERGAIVDYLFDSLEGKGFTIDSIDFSHRRARLVVSQVPLLDGEVEQAAAAVVFDAAPTPIDQVEIVQLAQGRQQSRAVVRRRDVRRKARVDQMFDSLEAGGFTVESLELAKGEARVYLSSASDAPGTVDYQAAAQLVAEHAPARLSSVQVVRLVAGVEAARVTLRRGARPSAQAPAAGRQAGGAAGDAAGGFVADLTDNEKTELALKIFKDLEAANFTVDKFEISRRKATVYLTPTKFREPARNVGRASRVIANHAPDSVEEIEVVTMNAGLETARVKILRKDLEAAAQRRGSPEEIWARATVSGPQASPPFGESPPGEVTVVNNPRRYPNLGWSIRPALRSHIGGPDAIYLYQVWLALSGSAELYRGLYVDGTLGKNIKSTLDEITLDSDSQLPHVRSDLKLYNQEGEDGNIVRLQADYLFQPAEEIFARVSAGLFEEMFGGVGGEILYRPYGSRLALSVDINQVRQRDYDQRFDFLNYEVTTGHLNVYYKLPFMGLLGEIHAGQFLAGDRGAQFAVLREFSSGIAVGAWATFTNVSAEQFGEGSFDKGISMRIPFEAFLTSSSLSGGSLAFRPLTRDGGQMLGIKRRLYGVVEGGNLDSVIHTWGKFMD